MRSTVRVRASLIALSLTPLMGGCPLALTPDSVPVNEVEIPATVAAVFADTARFRFTQNEARAFAAAGEAVDDLAALDGCWGAIWDAQPNPTQLGFYEVYRFDREAGTFSRTSFVGQIDGGLWPDFPVLTTERGTFQVVDATRIEMVDEAILANSGFAGIQRTQTRVTPPGYRIVRPALATLSGDTLLLWIDVASPDDVAAADEPPEPTLLRRFDCPVE